MAVGRAEKRQVSPNQPTSFSKLRCTPLWPYRIIGALEPAMWARLRACCATQSVAG